MTPTSHPLPEAQNWRQEGLSVSLSPSLCSWQFSAPFQPCFLFPLQSIWCCPSLPPSPARSPHNGFLSAVNPLLHAEFCWLLFSVGEEGKVFLVPSENQHWQPGLFCRTCGFKWRLCHLFRLLIMNAKQTEPTIASFRIREMAVTKTVLFWCQMLFLFLLSLPNPKQGWSTSPSPSLLWQTGPILRVHPLGP